MAYYSEMSQGKKKQTRPPPSREVEHKTINDAVNDICIDIRHFAKHYLNRSKYDYSAATDCLTKVLDSWKVKTDEVSSWNDFLDFQSHRSVQKKLKNSDEYQMLKLICVRAQEFEAVLPNTRERLQECLKEHVYKYCVSFSNESEGFNIRPVFDYEEEIKSFRKDIEYKMANIDEGILTYRDCKVPFTKFVSDGSVHHVLMEDTCVSVVGVCQVIKNWVGEDTSYPDKIMQEITFSTSYKEKINEDINSIYSNRTQLVEDIDKNDRMSWRVEKEYHIHKKEKRKLKQSLETVQNRINRLNKQIESKIEDISSIKVKISERSPKSPRKKDELQISLETAYEDQNRLEDHRDTMTRQENRLQKDMKKVSDRTYELKLELIAQNHDIENMRQSVRDMDKELVSLHHRIKKIDDKCDVMKKIRILKLSPDTLRKLSLRRKKDSVKSERKSKEHLEDACKYVANSIGRDWRKLYVNLPFSTLRRENTRLRRDAEKMDIIAARGDRTFEEQANISLEKWRTVNRREADVIQLANSLRKIHRPNLAEKVEEKFAPEDVY